MKKTLWGVALVAMALASPASASTDWTGFYAGLNAGVGMGTGQFVDGCYFCASDNYNHWFGSVGGQVGYNWQVNNVVVIGVDGSVEWDSLSHSGILGTDDYDFLREKQKLNWSASFRARAGLSVENALFYVTAGPAFGGVSAPGIEYCCRVLNPSAAPDGGVWSESDTRVGFTGGVGLEVATDGDWSWAVEYLYTDYGTKTANRVPVCGNSYVCSVQNSLTTNTVRVAINYHIAP